MVDDMSSLCIVIVILEAKLEHLPMQPGDVPSTAADMRGLVAWVGFQPNTRVIDGVANFDQWYRDFYNV